MQPIEITFDTIEIASYNFTPYKIRIYSFSTEIAFDN